MPIDFAQDLLDDSSHHEPDKPIDGTVVDVPIPPEVSIPVQVPVQPVAEVVPAEPEAAELDVGRAASSRVGLWLAMSFVLFLGSGLNYLKTNLAGSQVTPAPAPKPSPPVVAAVRVSPPPERLKALWNAGAQAKQRGDYALAYKKWMEGLKLDPSNQGFRDSLAKIRDNSTPTKP